MKKILKLGFLMIPCFLRPVHANQKLTTLNETTTPKTTDYMYIVSNSSSLKVTPASLLSLPGNSTSYILATSSNSLGAKIYPATSTPSFPYGLSGSTAIFSSTVTSGSFFPYTDDIFDLGAASFRWHDLYLSSSIHASGDSSILFENSGIFYGVSGIGLGIRNVGGTPGQAVLVGETGLSLGSDPSDTSHIDINGNNVLVNIAGTQEANFSPNSFILNNTQISSVLDPASAQDAATKNYVDTHNSRIYPATSTPSFPYGLSASSVQINNGSALGILSGASRARFRMGGIISLQNVNTDTPDSTGVFAAVASSGTGVPFYTMRRASGTTTSPVATSTGQLLGQMSAGGYGTTNWAGSSTGKIEFMADGDFTDSSQPTSINLYTTPTGSTATVLRTSIYGNGAITDYSSHTFVSTMTGTYAILSSSLTMANGWIAIGTTTPDGAPLDVYSNSNPRFNRLASTGSGNQVLFRLIARDLTNSVVSGFGPIFTFGMQDNTGAVLSNGGAHGVVWEDPTPATRSSAMIFSNVTTAGSSFTEKMRLTSQGFLGVNNSSPTANLYVVNTSTQNSFRVDDSASPDTTPFVIDQSGNVVIGSTTANGTEELSVIGQIESRNSSNPYLLLNKTNATARTCYIQLGTTGDGDAFDIFHAGASRLTIATNGNVGLSTTAATSRLMSKGAGTTTGANICTMNSSGIITSTIQDQGRMDLSGVINSTGVLTNNVPLGLSVSTYSASGTYSFTTTSATIAIGTSSSTITIPNPGTYRINAMANLRYTGATFAANQFVTLNLYRQNNTPGVVANSQTQEETQISVGALTNQFGQFSLPDIIYTTTNSNDILSLHGSISATPGAGSFDATEANILAIRIQ